MIDALIVFIACAVAFRLGEMWGDRQTKRMNNAPIKSTLYMHNSEQSQKWYIITRLSLDDWMIVPEVGEAFVLTHGCLAVMIEDDHWKIGRVRVTA